MQIYGQDIHERKYAHAQLPGISHKTASTFAL